MKKFGRFLAPGQLARNGPFMVQKGPKRGKFNISSSSGPRKMYDPSKEAQGPSLGGCLNIYVPLKPPEVP